jgi:hypothetical protein
MIKPLRMRLSLCCTALWMALLGGCAGQPYLNGSEHLVVHFERSGGLAGKPIVARADTDKLSPDDAQALRYMIEDAGFFELPTLISDVVPHPDRYHYKLSVLEKTPAYQNHEVTIEEGHVPGKLRPLLHWLTDRAQ